MEVSRRSGSRRTSFAARRLLTWAMFAAGTAAPPLPAQAPPAPQGRPWFASLSHYGRWVGLAGSAGLLTISALRHADADRRSDQLDALCASVPCTQMPDGRYANQPAEALRQESADLRRQARAWLLGGEVALLGTGAMFLLDLVYRDDSPRNIPFSPFAVFITPRTVGLRARF